MIEDIEAGLLDIVITKDLSRLGRDYIMTGYLTDIYFSRMGVRYIAVNDDIDTQRDNNDIAPFRNIMNDMLLQAIQSLPHPEKDILLMKNTSNMKLIDIARELGLNYHTTRTKYRRTLEKLSRMLR